MKRNTLISLIILALTACASDEGDNTNNISETPEILSGTTILFTGFQEYGDAFFNSNNALQLTTFGNTSERGYAYIDTPISVNKGTSFQVHFTYSANVGGSNSRVDYAANGITFILQNDPVPMAITTDPLERDNSKLVNGMGVFISEFPSAGISDLNGDFLQIFSNTDTFNTIDETRLGEEIATIDETPRHVWIDYAGSTNTIKVYQSLSNTKPSVPSSEAIFDLFDIVGDVAYVGMLARTGAPSVHTATHTIYTFEFVSSE